MITFTQPLTKHYFLTGGLMLLLLDLDTHLSGQPLYGLVLVMLAIPGLRGSSYG